MAYNPRRAASDEILNGPEIKAALTEITEKAKTIAVGLSQDFRVTGEYADSFEATVDVETVRSGSPRLVGRLTNHAPYAAAVEWGAEPGPRGTAADPLPNAHHVFGRTLVALEHGAD
jgi:hypothetical protein